MMAEVERRRRIESRRRMNRSLGDLDRTSRQQEEIELVKPPQDQDHRGKRGPGVALPSPRAGNLDAGQRQAGGGQDIGRRDPSKAASAEICRQRQDQEGAERRRQKMLVHRHRPPGKEQHAEHQGQRLQHLETFRHKERYGLRR